MTHLTESEREQYELCQKAHELVVALCKPRGSEGARQWIMSIPARPDYDPDLVIGSALRGSMALAEALSEARGQIEELREALKEFLTLREWVIEAGGTEGPLSQDVIRQFALLQNRAMNKAEAALTQRKDRK